ncbi:MAG: hypothetical protein ABL877_05180 [Thiobacillus sp.]
MKTKFPLHYFAGALLAGLSLLAAPVWAESSPEALDKKISFAPLPLEVHLQANDRPAVVAKMPCAMVNQMTMGFPPVAMAETLFFQMVKSMNDTNVMPARFEPVCI